MYLRAVHNGYADFSQRGMAEILPDKPREDLTELKDWAIDRGYWRWVNEANASGEFTDDGRALLRRLAEEV